MLPYFVTFLSVAQVFGHGQEYPDIGAGQYVAPPGLPPAMAPHDHEFVNLPKGKDNEVLPSPYNPYAQATVETGAYLERPETTTIKLSDDFGSGRESDVDESNDRAVFEGSSESSGETPNGSGYMEAPHNSGDLEATSENSRENEASGATEGSGIESSQESSRIDQESSGVLGSGQKIESSNEGSGVEGESSGIEGSSLEGSAESSGQEPSSSGISEEDMNVIMNNMNHVAQKSGIACPVDILFVIDSTSSVKGVFEDYKKYVIKVIQGLTVSPTQDHAGVVLFSGPKKQREKIKLGQINDPGKLTNAVKGLPFLSGITATGAALNFAKSSLANRRKYIPTIVVVLTDGFSYDLTSEAAKQLRKMEKVKVFTVSFGSPTVEKELLSIAGDKSRFLQGENSYGKLVNLIKNCPTKQNRAPKVETATIRHIETATDHNGRHLIPNPVITNKGYKHFDDRKDAAVIGSPIESQNVSLTERERHPAAPSCQNDIVIVFDASGSSKSNFKQQLELANELVDKFVVGPNDTQIAAIKFAGKTNCRTLFNLTDFSNPDSIKKKINETSFSSGITATDEALLKAVELFNGPGSRKETAKPILILFTDGFSTASPIKGATYLHKMGVTVFVIGIGKKPEDVYMEELHMIASDSAHVYLLSNFDKFLVDLEILGKNCVAH